MKNNLIVFSLTTTVWALVAAATVFWLFQWTASPSRASIKSRQAANIVTTAEPISVQANAADLEKLLGYVAPSSTLAPQAASRFKLLGVVTQGSGGAALLTVDNQPAKAYQVGSRLDDNTVLQAVGLRHVVLGSGDPGVEGQKIALRPPLKASNDWPTQTRSDLKSDISAPGK